MKSYGLFPRDSGFSTDYSDSFDPRINNEFAGAAFRYEIMKFNNHWQLSEAKPIFLADLDTAWFLDSSNPRPEDAAKLSSKWERLFSNQTNFKQQGSWMVWFEEWQNRDPSCGTTALSRISEIICLNLVLDVEDWIWSLSISREVEIMVCQATINTRRFVLEKRPRISMI